MSSAKRDVTIRRLEPRDLPAALAIQAQAYPAFLREDEAAFASRIETRASYCFAALREDRLIAYLLAHGWASLAPPPIGTILPPEAPGDILFIHDLAVSPEGRGSGIGRELVSRALDLAARDGLVAAELVAVEGAEFYWETLGFRQIPCSELAEKIKAYGVEAKLMHGMIGDLRAQYLV